MRSGFYPFVQIETPFELGPPDGRWMVRAPRSDRVQRVIVLQSVEAARADRGRAARRRSSPRLRSGSAFEVGRRRVAASAAGDAAEPPAIPIARATVVEAQPIEQEDAARAWLECLDAEQEVEVAFAALNRLLAAHRIAAADPYAHEVAPAQALALRAGFGTGEQVAQGRWSQARELALRQTPRWRRGRRAAILRSHERLAHLLASEPGGLLCEELSLRARLDLDSGRLACAASELERALAAAAIELAEERSADLPARVAELRQLHERVREIAERLLPAAAAGPAGEDPAAVIAQALGRLEAALRARATAITWR